MQDTTGDGGMDLMMMVDPHTGDVKRILKDTNRDGHLDTELLDYDGSGKLVEMRKWGPNAPGACRQAEFTGS